MGMSDCVCGGGGSPPGTKAAHTGEICLHLLGVENLCASIHPVQHVPTDQVSRDHPVDKSSSAMPGALQRFQRVYGHTKRTAGGGRMAVKNNYLSFDELSIFFGEPKFYWHAPTD